ncbi:MAG: Era-like GTP-binding protein [Nanoarchaeota archaeon]|nr:Era-like GTP-binding protein [Nanoarchaeota archaeon]
MITQLRDFLNGFFFNLFNKKNNVKIGLYGPPNSGKTSIANKICKDWLGEGQEMGTVSPIPHETREVKVKEKIKIKRGGKTLSFNLVDTPGITTKIDYEEFLSYDMNKKDAQKRAKEATKGVIEAIKWLDNMDCVIVVLDATKNPYSQVNITIIGNMAARNIPVLVVGNKMDMRKANLKRIESAFPQYNVVGLSALKGTNFDEFYDTIYKLVK